jgi:hypothetical protein
MIVLHFKSCTVVGNSFLYSHVVPSCEMSIKEYAFDFGYSTADRGFSKI